VGTAASAVRASTARLVLASSISHLEPNDSILPRILSTQLNSLYHEQAKLRSAGQPRAAVPSSAFMPQAFYRRKLPHLQIDDKPHFVTFCTEDRWVLPPVVRSFVIESCLHDNGQKFDLKVAVVMPDHVHLIFTPLIDYEAMEVCSLAEIMDAIKGASAHRVNKFLGRKGRVWQPESFDHALRSSESLDAKIQYLLENPVRQGLARDWHEYPWLWKKAFVNPYSLNAGR
jgi:REP element-mobilizing transposase RayT